MNLVDNEQDEKTRPVHLEQAASPPIYKRISGFCLVAALLLNCMFIGKAIGEESVNHRDCNHPKFALAIQHCNKKQWSEAIKKFDMVLEDEYYSATTLSKRAYCHLKLGNDAESILDLTRAISIKPEAKDYLLRATIYRKNGLSDRAMDDLNQIINYNFAVGRDLDAVRRQVARAYQIRGKILLEYGYRTQAEKNFGKANNLLIMVARW